jgi:hypothetical protein
MRTVTIAILSLALSMTGLRSGAGAESPDGAGEREAAEAARPPEDPDEILTPETKSEVVHNLIQVMEDLYVLPETTRRVREDLRSRLARGEFDRPESGPQFSAELTRILQELSRDLHLRVSFGSEEGAGLPGCRPRRIVRTGPEEGAGLPGCRPRRIVRTVPEIRQPGTGAVPAGLEEVKGFTKAEMLSGNVGYVEVRLFPGREWAEDEAVRAMNAVAGADALIFDLRACMGGVPDMVHLIISYLYGPEPMHLLTYYHAHTDPDSAYTLAEIPGERMPDVDVYVLTSSLTGSGGEEFAYDLKHHGRATLVGETTAGAGHGGSVHAIGADFHAFIPDFRPVHPATGTGWEGVGVVPHVRVPARLALAHAHRDALRKRVASLTDPRELEVLQREIERLDGELSRDSGAGHVDVDALREYAGKYEIRTITVSEEGLFLQRVGGPKLRLVPEEEPDRFFVELVPAGKVRFVRDETGVIVEMNVLNLEGDWETSRRER